MFINLFHVNIQYEVPICIIKPIIVGWDRGISDKVFRDQCLSTSVYISHI
jgi:hypothetical protein